MSRNQARKTKRELDQRPRIIQEVKSRYMQDKNYSIKVFKESSGQYSIYLNPVEYQDMAYNKYRANATIILTTDDLNKVNLVVKFLRLFPYPGELKNKMLPDLKSKRVSKFGALSEVCIEGWKDVGFLLERDKSYVQRLGYDGKLPYQKPERSIKVNLLDIIKLKYSNFIITEKNSSKDTGRPFKNSKFTKVMGALAITILSILIFKIIVKENKTIKFDNINQPHSGNVEKNVLNIVGQNGNMVWKKPFPSLAPYSDKLMSQFLIVDDVNEDGKNEVIFLCNPGDVKKTSTSRIYCYDHKGNIIWDFAFGKEKIWGNNPPYNALYDGRLLAKVRIQDKHWLIASASHQFFPSQTVLLDPNNGRLIREYWNTGHTQAVAFLDLDHDQVPELLLGGANNPGPGIGHAILSIFKWPYFEKPQPPLIPENREWGGGEFRVFLFPNTDLSGVNHNAPWVKSIVKDAEKTLKITVYIGSKPPHLTYSIFYWLDYQGRVLRCQFNDPAIGYHKELFLQERLDHPYHPQEIGQWCFNLSFPHLVYGNSDEVKEAFKNALRESTPIQLGEPFDKTP